MSSSRQPEFISRANRLLNERTAVAVSGQETNDDAGKYTVRDGLVNVSLLQQFRDVVRGACIDGPDGRSP